MPAKWVALSYARARRRRFARTTVVCVTGSVGKTTTAYLLAAIAGVVLPRRMGANRARATIRGLWDAPGAAFLVQEVGANGPRSHRRAALGARAGRLDRHRGGERPPERLPDAGCRRARESEGRHGVATGRRRHPERRRSACPRDARAQPRVGRDVRRVAGRGRSLRGRSRRLPGRHLVPAAHDGSHAPDSDATALVVLAGRWAHHGLRARVDEDDRSILAFASVPEAGDFLRSELGPDDLVLLKGTHPYEHLARVALQFARPVLCRSVDCRRKIECERCRLLERPARRMPWTSARTGLHNAGIGYGDR